MADTVTLTIDGLELHVPRGTLVIRAAEALQITIPRFCDHPLLDPVAACRQCLVEVEGQPKPMTACSTQCQDGMVVRTHLTSDMARRAQQAELEFLLINHPLDCPMCDKGGECPLQDQALAHGPGHSRFIDHKRRFAKPVPISAQVALDRERCVLCARCTRFSQEISGDPFIEMFDRGALQEVAIYEHEPYDSYYSGNVVQICPVGALTATSYRFAARPFDVRSVDGICNQCANGCNLRIDIRNGRIERQLARTNLAVNEMWNCDKGRFGFEFVAHPARLATPKARTPLGSVEQTTWRAAFQAAAERLRAAVDQGGPDAVGVLTGGNLTDEDAYAASRFARDVLGTDNVDFRRAPRTAEEREVLRAIAGTQGPTYDDVERAAVVVVAGLDTEEEAPIMHLRLRKAWRKHGQKVVVVGPVLGSMEEMTWRWMRTPPGGEAGVLHALAGRGESELADLAASNGRCVVLAGERLARSPGALAAAARLATASDAGAMRQFAWVPRKAGARGAVDAGLLPGLLPGGRGLDDPGPVAGAWNRLPDTPGLDARGILEAATAGAVRALYLIGFDPVRDFEDAQLAERALQRVDSVIVQDLLETSTTPYADVILPAAAPQERVGSFTTWEGRRQPFPQVVPPLEQCLEDWDIVRQLARVMGADLGWETAMDVRREAAPLMQAPVSAAERLAGVPEPVIEAEPRADDQRLDAVLVPALLGRGSMLVGADALNATARAPVARIHPEDAETLGLADGQDVRVFGAAGDSIELPLSVSRTVAPGGVVLPESSTEPPAGILSTAGAPLRVALESRSRVGATAEAE